jgi:hypothetical protein
MEFPHKGFSIFQDLCRGFNDDAAGANARGSLSTMLRPCQEKILTG